MYHLFKSSDIHQYAFDSKLGMLHIGIEAKSLQIIGIWFIDQRDAPIQLKESHHWSFAKPSDLTYPLLKLAAQQLEDYFNGKLKQFNLPLYLSLGTPFQRSVWQVLSQIPFGETRTYSEIAHKIQNPKAVRAVGSAIGRNPWSLVVPCHRVIGSNGSLTGYAGGLHRKSFLLDLEKSTI